MNKPQFRADIYYLSLINEKNYDAGYLKQILFHSDTSPSIEEVESVKKFAKKQTPQPLPFL